MCTSMAVQQESGNPTPLFSFGVIADVQYADQENKLDFHGVNWRYYRQSLVGLRQAVEFWNSDPEGHQVNFVLQLGDLIDGVNSRMNQSQAAFTKTLSELDVFKGVVHHTWGNHELYNFKRTTLLNTPLNSSPHKNVSYYAFSPHPDFLFIMLETFSMSMLGYQPHEPPYIESKAFLESRNTNSDFNDPSGLRGVDRRYCKFNGAVDDEQLQWLDETLEQAQKSGQKVIIAGHQPILPESCNSVCLCWNYDEVLAVLHRHSCVLAYLCGHDHTGGDAWDTHGIHHITMPGAIEAQPDDPDFGTVLVYRDHMDLKGNGRVPNGALACW